METKVVIVDNTSKDEKDILEAASIIKKGGIVIFPTETVYGIGADALNAEAVKKIFIAKGRPQDNPLIVHVHSKNIENIAEDISEEARIIIEKFWPGPLTVILKKKASIPEITSAGLQSIGIRMPDNKLALKLIELSGTPIAAPSANISGRPSPTDIDRCIEDMTGKVDYIIGGEICQVGVESTILDCTVDPPIILRPGGITLEMLKDIDNRIEIDKGVMEMPTENLKPKAPGMKYKHYSPKATVKIISGDRKKTVDKINEMVQYYKKKGLKVGVLAAEENSKNYVCTEIINIGSISNMNHVAHNLFESLRSFDDKGVDIILAEAFPEKGIGIAVMNRLKKAAGYDITNV